MDLKLVKSFSDACVSAKKITDLISLNISGYSRNELNVIDTLHSLQEEHSHVRSLEVAMKLDFSRSMIKKYVDKLEEKKMLQKYQLANDKRTYIKLTESGRKCYSKHIESYRKTLVELFKNVSNTDMRTTVNTIQQIYYLVAHKHEKK
ncbi:MAG: hypothetical protein IKI31_02995 [Treponema sp.]|nr:hypothetical protein [Treponema sp.]